ncbi:MAG: amidohydrolase family protein [Candidatus Lokiarchaeota archaeon]|nr:amidohydrolase family protein [Candidatus Lokiarchaeota archaeon]
MNRLIIKNGLVYDPINNIEGEKKDILVESGKIVDKFTGNKDIKEIDATGKTIIPSAIDIHTHVASQQVNWARLLGSNNDKFNEVWQGLTLKNIAKAYVSMGYTFILEANVFPSLAKQTIFNFQQMPILDKAMLLNISNFWPLELEFQRDKTKDMAVFLSDLLSKTYGFGFKVYNPFECEVWNFKEMREDLSKQGRLYNFSALDVYTNIVKCIESMGLPHSAHVHIEGYENSIGNKNLFDVLETINSLGLEPNQLTNFDIKREQIMHVAHANSYATDGNNTPLIDYFNQNNKFSLDLSFIGFNQINPLITSDRRIINSMLKMDAIDNPHKLISSAIEFEGDSFTTTRILEKNNYQHCTLWANAIDLALNIKNKSQVCFSLNFPNYAMITDIPEILTWLINQEARQDFMKGMNDKFLNDCGLASNDKVLNFSEIVSITRVSPAKSLGLGSIKGNLGLGADGDINVLNLNLEKTDISKDAESFRNAFTNIEYVIKSGEIVKNQEKLAFNLNGSIIWSNGQAEVGEKDFIMSKKKEFFQKYSSLFYDSYKTIVEDKFLRKID